MQVAYITYLKGMHRPHIVEVYNGNGHRVGREYFVTESKAKEWLELNFPRAEIKPSVRTNPPRLIKSVS